MKHREERTWVQAYLDQEKHVLRHMQGKWTEIYGLFENMVDHICCKIEHCYWLRKAVFLSLTTVRRYVSPDSADFVEWVLYHRFFFGPFLLFCGPVSVAYFLTAVSLLTELLRAFPRNGLFLYAFKAVVLCNVWEVQQILSLWLYQQRVSKQLIGLTDLSPWKIWRLALTRIRNTCTPWRLRFSCLFVVFRTTNQWNESSILS